MSNNAVQHYQHYHGGLEVSCSVDSYHTAQAALFCVCQYGWYKMHFTEAPAGHEIQLNQAAKEEEFRSYMACLSLSGCLTALCRGDYEWGMVHTGTVVDTNCAGLCIPCDAADTVLAVSLASDHNADWATSG